MIVENILGNLIAAVIANVVHNDAVKTALAALYKTVFRLSLVGVKRRLLTPGCAGGIGIENIRYTMIIVVVCILSFGAICLRTVLVVDYVNYRDGVGSGIGRIVSTLYHIVGIGVGPGENGYRGAVGGGSIFVIGDRLAHKVSIGVVDVYHNRLSDGGQTFGAVVVSGNGNRHHAGGLIDHGAALVGKLLGRLAMILTNLVDDVENKNVTKRYKVE